MAKELLPTTEIHIKTDKKKKKTWKKIAVLGVQRKNNARGKKQKIFHLEKICKSMTTLIKSNCHC
jgi:hypothetical protein